VEHVGEDEGLDGEVALGEVEPEAEGHDGLVDEDGGEDAEQVGGVRLEPDGDPLEHAVEGEGEQQHDGPQAGVLEGAVADVAVVVVTVVRMVNLFMLSTQQCNQNILAF
jgi:hypothetical protein